MLRRSLAAAFLVVLAVGCLFVTHNLGYHARDMDDVRAAGFTEHQTGVTGSTINYAEGPDGGQPPLLLIHGQLADWTSYAKDLPALSKHYHVFAVDCYGHGKSARAVAKYSAVGIGDDLATFIDKVIGKPVVLSGHSSGGLIATYLAATYPSRVRAVLLEDPPLFTTIPPRSHKTWNYVDLATTAHTFLSSGQKDFVAYYIEHSQFFSLFGNGRSMFVRYALWYHRKHLDEPTKFWFFPASLNEVWRAMGQYDPRFGDAFYTDSFDAGFDHERSLSRIKVPTILVHTNFTYGNDGVLRGAMDDKDAARAKRLLPANSVLHTVDSGHAFHFEDPDRFVQYLLDLRKQVG